MNLTEVEKAYLAGLFDGEGCVGYYSRSRPKGVSYHSASVHVCMTDPRPVQWIKSKTGVGHISFITKSGNRCNVYSWQLSNQAEIRQFLSVIRPYLLLKADQVDILFDLWNIEDELPKGSNSVTQEVRDRREAVRVQMKLIKKVNASKV